MSTVKDPTANNNSGFLWGIGVLLVIIAVVLGFIFYQNRGASVEGLEGYTKQDVNMEMSFADNAVTLKAADAKDAPEVELYEDLSLIHI